MSTWEDIEKWLDQSKEKRYNHDWRSSGYEATPQAIQSRKDMRAAVISLQSKADESDQLREMLKEANRRITEMEIQAERDARNWDESLEEAMRNFRNEWEANAQISAQKEPKP